MRFPYRQHGGTRVAARTSTVALMPEVLDQLGVERPAILQGRPGLQQTNPDDVIADYRAYFDERHRGLNREIAHRYPALIAKIHHSHVLYCGRHKLMVHSDGSAQFFDLAADAAEQNDLAPHSPPELSACLSRYAELVQAGRFTPFQKLASSEENEDPEQESDKALLKSLGYIP